MVGDARDIVDRFAAYRGEVERLVGTVSGLYEAGRALPVPGDQDTVRVLHVSDLHLDPVGLDRLVRSRREFRVSLVVDSGDLTDHGTDA